MISFRTTSGEVIQPPPYTPKGAVPKKGADGSKAEVKGASKD